MEREIYILNEIVQLMHDSAPDGYEEAICEFSYEKYEDSWSVGSKYSFVRDGVSFSELLDDPDDEISGLVRELHQVMEQENRENWEKFTIKLSSSGAAKTNFFYDSSKN
ncbi:immunity protein YezG family protein [Xanthomonas rydalmerensis]|uniref:DUF600 family protein n=1 Tax=Xanthomonas rydalmerensis TaxID=3046274 RepID=A0ABZ0JN75_9XANT|nr:immunity protein YezG family protein [Xanthomonas sp. DM-2023]WOS40861.1 DUF600 family protein [Xanthomonas sp. DM-2023]WOS45046.1 DUF600 family protein [Xanthomonas sp. DM-2023]WOS49225.1 DUF600 family protein [Xanthomonas sp. DM-2023]WOS53405.1 DUF600 family protein [Xanthomonas sp. DM-2023]WOS57588.1 DUF600 family protein [Xanthomonas sp. DM-2023]